MDKKTAQELIEKTFNNAFNEEQFTVFTKNLLNDFEAKHNRYSGILIWDGYKEHINTYKRIGKYIDPDGEALDVLIIEVKSVTKLERARTALRNFVIKHLSKFEKDYALVAFYSKEDNGDDWRFSFIKLEYRSELDDEKGKVNTKKEFTPAKRYSFLVGKYEKAHTAKNQLLPLLQNISNNPTIEELEAAFSIEKVTDEFFNQYKDLYIKLYEHFENDRKVKAAIKKAGIDIARFTKKLLGQIVFLYFLQKKGWLGVGQNAKWGTGKKRFVQELYEQAKKEKVNFFKDKLQYLFYEALAKERDNVNSYYKRFDCRIPFLNGGLFEADYHWQEANITIPENLFRNEEKNKSGDVGTGILDVFDRYNFTIKEDEPLDKEVAVDPEMLGKVFENMLDITERKSKGAFYTPREIVHYMCQESLIHYLDNALNYGTSSYQELGSDQTKLFGGSTDKKGNLKIELEHGNQILVPKKNIELFIREGHFALENDERVATKGETKTYQYQLPESIRNNADLIDQKLSSIKICDPSIGSGAFPVGLLHELVNAMLVLKPHLGYDYLTEKLKGFGFTHRESISDSRYIYRLKRHIIQESIYGVDIDNSAIDIARLRLWLSLVVDEDDLDPIETLPNLDYKIVAGNSLIGLPDGAMKDLKVEADLEKLKERFYDITEEKEKKALRQQINTKIRELLDSAEQFAGYKIDFDFKLFFSEVWREKGGFDVVIGNPPYVQIKQIEEKDKQIFKKLFKFTNGRFNLFYLFVELSPKISGAKGVTSLIIPDRFLLNTQCGDIRRWLIKENNLIEIDSFENQVFANAVVDSVIIIFKNEKANNNHFLSRYNCNLDNLSSISPKQIPNIYVLQSPSNQFDLNYDYGTDLTISKIRNNSVHLELIGDTKDGIIQSKIPDLLFLKEKINENCKKLLFGKEIEQYKLTYNGHWVHYDIELMKKEEDKRGGGGLRMRNEGVFERSKILTRQTADRIIGTLDEMGVYYYSNTLHGTHITDSRYHPKFVLSQLNSDVINFYYKKTTNEEGKVFAQIKIELLKMMPIKFIDNQNSFVCFVDYLIELKKQIQINSILFSFFESVLNSLVYEIHFPEELKSAGKEILKHLGDLKPITDDMSEEKKLAIIQSEFERLYDPNHPVRFAIETLDSVEEVRIIKEALK
jgi:hypothetical protein